MVMPAINQELTRGSLRRGRIAGGRHSFVIHKILAFFKINPGEGFRVAVIAALLFLLIAANNLIKILRDSIFLGHHPVSELPYLYILVALFAGVTIATYTRYTAHLSLIRLILATNAIVVLIIGGFWFLLTYIDPAWSHYAFYIWSAMATVIAVAQLWTLANQIFNTDQGKRLFGLLTAGGTIGGVTAAFGARWSIHLTYESNHLLWIVGGLYVIASVLLALSRRKLTETHSGKELLSTKTDEAVIGDSIYASIASSRYLKTIAVVILVSVIVSTLIDFELKTAAKEIYPSKSALAGFFSSYYGWLSVVTLFSQVILTGKTLTKLGLSTSLYVTPVALLTGVLAIIVWPGLIAAALTRIADATLRNSIHRSSMEIIYMALPAGVMRSIKTFLDVVVERVGDASAGFIILFFSLTSIASYKAYVHIICVVLIFAWMVLTKYLQAGYAAAMEMGLSPSEALMTDGLIATNQVKRTLSE
jgi:ATP:ADP antiporter, AAA family